MTTNAEDEIQHMMDTLTNNARQQFLGAVMSLSWRLALTVLVPMIVGLKLDERFNSAPSYTLTGFMLAAVGGCIAVWSTVKEVNKEQAEEEKDKKHDK